MLDPYIQAYGPRLYGLCLHLCGEKQEAEDLYQETWLAPCGTWVDMMKTSPSSPG